MTEEKEDRQIERSQGVDGAPDHRTSAAFCGFFLPFLLRQHSERLEEGRGGTRGRRYPQVIPLELVTVAEAGGRIHLVSRMIFP